jgi:alpha-L-arabinofuranosidase
MMRVLVLCGQRGGSAGFRLGSVLVVATLWGVAAASRAAAAEAPPTEDAPSIASAAAVREARIIVDAARVEGQIDSRLYGQFAEFMYEGVKRGLSAELVRNRGFDEAANNLGLPYYVNLLYGQHLGRDRLKTTVEGPTFDASREGTRVPALDAVVSRSKGGREIYVKVVVTDPTSAVTTRVDLRGVDVDPQATWHLITADSLETRNSFATPDAIRPRREVIPAGGSFQVSLPPHSVSVITLRVNHSEEARP